MTALPYDAIPFVKGLPLVGNLFKFGRRPPLHRPALCRHEVKAVMHQVLRRWRLSAPDGYRIPYQLVPIAKPRDGLPIRLPAV